MNSTATWIIFGLLFAAIVGFLLFTFLNDKWKKNKIMKKRIELRRATSKTSKELAIRIYTLIEINNEYVNKVIPGISKIKMRNVNLASRSFLKDIYDSKSFKVLYIDSDDADPLYSQNMKNLIDTKSNLWNKYCSNAIHYFKKFHDELRNDENFEIIKADSQKIINDYFQHYLEEKNESAK